MQADGVHESMTRRMLAASDTAARRRAAGRARALAAGRHFHARPASPPLIPYNQAEWARLHQACRDG